LLRHQRSEIVVLGSDFRTEEGELATSCGKTLEQKRDGRADDRHGRS
jgi:hypothetical protein